MVGDFSLLRAFVVLTLVGTQSLFGTSAPQTLPSQSRIETTASLALATSTSSSLNWSGYVARGGTYTEVYGSWVVPRVAPSTGTYAADATWVGIGGVRNQNLIQAGTQAIILLAVGMFTTYQTVRHLDPYFAVSDALAAEEKVVGEHIRTAAPSRWFVAAGYQELCAIKYYAASMHPLALTQSTTLVQGDVVLVAQKDRTAVALPKRVRMLHDGPRLLVVQVY